MRSLEYLAARVRAEYREMPGLSLTADQASRLCGIHVAVCKTVLQELVLDGALYVTPGGAYRAAPATRDRV
jgi:hypothetical protein